MNVFCNGCGMCCKLIPVKSGDNVLVRDGFQTADESFLNGLVPLSSDSARKINEDYVNKVQEKFPLVKFYRCKHLSAENKCSLDKKPPVCENFPKTPLAIIPDECSCAGDVFIKNEELKRKIRMIKEEILDYETLIAIGDKDSDSYKKIVENLKRFIAKYKDFGAEDW